MTINDLHQHPSENVSPTLRAGPHDGSHANGGVMPAVMTLAIRGRENESTLEAREDGTANAILTPNGGRGGIGVGAVAVPETALTVSAEMYRSGGAVAGNNDQGVRNCIVSQYAVRRLTPLECERLMGFPDAYTKIPWSGWRNMDATETPESCRGEGLEVKQTKRGKWRVKDVGGPRYKALGNSIALNVLRFVGERIARVSNL